MDISGREGASWVMGCSTSFLKGIDLLQKMPILFYLMGCVNGLNNSIIYGNALNSKFIRGFPGDKIGLSLNFASSYVLCKL